MKKILFYLIALVVIPTSFLSSQIYAKTYHIMLQGFHWRSSSVSEGWYKIIHDNSQRIKDSGFTLIWLPPPSKSTSPQGYEPNQLNNLTSAYGNENQLKAAINITAQVFEVLLLSFFCVICKRYNYVFDNI